MDADTNLILRHGSPVAAIAPPAFRPVNRKLAALAVAAIAACAYAGSLHGGGRMAALLVLGAALGVTLYHASFSFTGAWRSFLTEGRGTGLRAQIVMLAVATALFLPLLSKGVAFGVPLAGAVAPLGISVVVGAFLFGVGMQLGGACASGTLSTVGGGNARMVITLAFFMVGAVVGTWHLPWWLELPTLEPVSLLTAFGLRGALAIHGGALAALFLATVAIEIRRHGSLAGSGPRGTMPAPRALLRGPWPLMVGGVALALLNVGVLVTAGHPWNASFGFTLWGAKIAQLAGLDVANWAFWTWDYPRQSLEGSIFAEATSITNIGIVLGALLAAALAGKFVPSHRVPPRIVLASVVGGLLMGYGARLAFGCNIGAFFSGVASGSVHGWLWFVMALAGSYLGIRLRKYFALHRAD